MALLLTQSIRDKDKLVNNLISSKTNLICNNKDLQVLQTKEDKVIKKSHMINK
jgi:hypothetical protein